MKKPKYIVGNWKMNPVSNDEALKIHAGISRKLALSKKTRVILCPSFLHLPLLKGKAGKGSIEMGAQDVFHEEKGSFTGEISVGMLSGAGASHVIIGHSERRKSGESDLTINKKVLLALKYKLIPILCIGETVRDEEGKYYAHIRAQLEKGLAGTTKQQLSKMIVAYEPVWAIGAAAAMDAHDVHVMSIFIKKTLFDIYSIKGDLPVPILYGGSVDPTNAESILTKGEADGLLIGRQSLVPESFLEIIKIAQSI